MRRRYDEDDVEKEMIELKENINKIKVQILQNKEKAQQKQKEYYDKQIKNKIGKIEAGDMVYVKNNKEKRKKFAALKSKFIGPFEVVSVISSTTLQLKVNGRLETHNTKHIKLGTVNSNNINMSFNGYAKSKRLSNDV